MNIKKITSGSTFEETYIVLFEDVKKNLEIVFAGILLVYHRKTHSTVSLSISYKWSS